LFVTISGEQQNIAPSGAARGWPSTVLCTTEAFWDEAVFAEAAAMTWQQASGQIAEQVRALNPAASAARIARFIQG